MKTLIVYAGKHGATEEMARSIREELAVHNCCRIPACALH